VSLSESIRALSRYFHRFLFGQLGTVVVPAGQFAFNLSEDPEMSGKSDLG
jgi:hypothetical protein